MSDPTQASAEDCAASTAIPSAAIIEIIESGRTPEATGVRSFITPRELRINGQSMLTPAGSVIQVEEIRLGDARGIVAVTVTLVARRVTIAAEGDLQGAGQLDARSTGRAMTEPTPLAYEQLAPVVTALCRRESALAAGAGILCPPFPDCPNCGQQPTDLLVNSDHPAHFLEDRVGFGFRPCGHNFTAGGEDVHRAYGAARAGAS